MALRYQINLLLKINQKFYTKDKVFTEIIEEILHENTHIKKERLLFNVHKY